MRQELLAAHSTQRWSAAEFASLGLVASEHGIVLAVGGVMCPLTTAQARTLCVSLGRLADVIDAGLPS